MSRLASNLLHLARRQAEFPTSALPGSGEHRLPGWGIRKQLAPSQQVPYRQKILVLLYIRAASRVPGPNGGCACPTKPTRHLTTGKSDIFLLFRRACHRTGCKHCPKFMARVDWLSVRPETARRLPPQAPHGSLPPRKGGQGRRVVVARPNPHSENAAANRAHLFRTLWMAPDARASREFRPGSQ